jgi:hypothetical protein
MVIMIAVNLSFNFIVSYPPDIIEKPMPGSAKAFKFDFRVFPKTGVLGKSLLI